MLWSILWCAIFVWGLYHVLVKPHRYWSQRNVEQGRLGPFLMNNFGMLFRLQTFPEMVQAIYTTGSGLPYTGFYQMLVPTLMINDPQVIKTVLVKDFDHFTNHRALAPDGIDPLWNKNLFALRDESWHRMRSKISSVFSRKKMRYLFDLTAETSLRLTTNLQQEHSNSLANIEMKDLCNRYVSDAIAYAVFSIQVDSLKDPTNSFFMMGKEATDLTSIGKMLRLLTFLVAPNIYKRLRIKFFSYEVRQFFTNVVKNSIRQRAENNIYRPDVIHWLMQGSSSMKQPMMSDQDITPHALLFFFAGFDTVSSTMCFMAYELAVNPTVQSRLCEEIKSVHKEHNGKLSYGALDEMQYMDMVVSEVLRKWPVFAATERVCSKPYTLITKEVNGSTKALNIEKGTVIGIPIYALHRDPKYYPQPDKFDPDRFSAVNKSRLANSCTYLPFGGGPRTCLGTKFAQLMIKTFFFHLLCDFEIMSTHKTDIPLKISKHSFVLTAENDFWLGLKRKRIGNCFESTNKC